MNDLIKRVKETAFGFMSFKNYRIRSLLYAGGVNWSLLKTLLTREDPHSSLGGMARNQIYEGGFTVNMCGLTSYTVS